MAKIAAINADSEKVNVAIQGYPTIKFFVDGKMSDYSGERSAKGIIDFVLTQYKKVFSILFRSLMKESVQRIQAVQEVRAVVEVVLPMKRMLLS